LGSQKDKKEKAGRSETSRNHLLMVLGAGIEPAHPEGYRILSPVRLPIPPPKHLKKISISGVSETNGEIE
jgi:hypothetical protein